MSGTFYDQLSGVAAVFEGWTVCERTVVLCALLRRVPWCNLKLLNRAIESAVSLQTCPDTQKIETEANDAAIVAQTTKTTDDDDAPLDMGEKLRKLLIYLPLLEPNNDKAKEVYLNAVPAIVQMCVDSDKYTDECQQMLSYLLIHPGLNTNDRKSLAQWLKYLENHLSKDMWTQRTDSSSNGQGNGTGAFRRTIGKNVDFKGANNHDGLQESFTKNGKDMDLNMDDDHLEVTLTQPKQRSNSLTPPMPSYMHMSSSAENLNRDEHFVQKPRSFSLSSEHMAQIKPMLATTGSETRLDDLKSNNFGEHIGMSTVAHWLKSLRLHKYVWLFSNISYEQMMSIDEEYLQKLGVTKGARHKLLLSISKLHERGAMLEAMQRELAAGGLTPPAMAQLLEQLRGIIISPMSLTSPLPAHIVSVLEMASTRLLSGSQVYPPMPAYPAYNHYAEEHSAYELSAASYDPVSLHCWLVDKALHHPAFNWNQELVETLKRMRYRLPPRQFFSHLSELPFTKRTLKPRWRVTGTSNMLKPQPHNQQKRLSIHTNWLPTHKLTTQNSQEPKYKSSSYPSFPPTALGQPETPKLTGQSNMSASLGDINSRLESLCLQMTEQAIN